MTTSTTPHNRRPPATAAGASSSSVAAAEAENDAILRALIADVRSLRTGFSDVGAEVKQHNTLLDSVSRTMSSASSGLKKSMRKLEAISEGSTGVKHMWLLLLLVVVVLIFLWLLLKRKGY